MTDNELLAVVTGLLLVYAWGTWVLWRGKKSNRLAGLLFVWAPVLLLIYVALAAGTRLALALVLVAAVMGGGAVRSSIVASRRAQE